MPLNHGELARREQGRLELCPAPMRLRWLLDDLVTADGHALRINFTCSVEVLTTPAERQMLEEVFLSGMDVLSGERAAAHFHEAFRAAAGELCQGKSVSDLLSSPGRLAVVQTLKTAGDRVAFSCGLHLVPPFEAELTSPTLEQQRVESMQRSLAEQRAAGQVEHFQRAAALLKQFEEIRATSPQLSAGDVLKQINPADQGMLLQTLLLASAREKATNAIWAVAGPCLLRIDITSARPTVQVIELPTVLGPLRSVQPAQSGPMLLIGARSGVIYVDPSRPAEAEYYADPDVASSMGFSRAILWNEQIWACHSEAGVVGWSLGQMDRPIYALRPADMGGAQARNLVAVSESQLLFSDKNRLLAMSLVENSPLPVPLEPDATSEIIAILPDASRLLVVMQDGSVQVRDPRTLEILRSEKRAGTATSAALLPWLGTSRLLLGTESGAVMCIGLQDDLVSQYVSPHRGLRVLAAAADVIVGLTEDRQRIVYWKTWDAKAPAAEVYVPAMARHRAVDIDLT